MAVTRPTTQAAPPTTAQPAGGARGFLSPAMRYGKSFGIGSAFAVGWTPCIGPILGAVLTMAAVSGTALQGTFLLVAWSLGLGLPFLIAGLMLAQVMTGMRKIRPIMPMLEVVGGVLVIFIGALIFLDQMTVFNQYFTGGTNTVIGAEEGLDGIAVTGVFGFVAAFAAGVIAFLSPCTLPMVPAYLMHPAGVSTEGVKNQRGVTFRHSLAFVSGFSVLFIILGASAGAVGFVIQDHLATLQKVAGVLLIVLGLNLLGILKIPWLSRTYQFDFSNTPGGGDSN